MRAVLHQALFLSSSELLDLRGGRGGGFGKSGSRLVQVGFKAADVGFEILNDSRVRAILHQARFLSRRELLDLGGGLGGGLGERGSRGGQRRFEAADVLFEIANNNRVRTVLHQALFLRGRKLLDLRGGRSSGAGESGSGLVQVGFKAVDVGFEIADDRFVRTVLHQALFLGGRELLQLCNHRGHLLFRLILGLVHLFLNDLEVFLEILDNFIVGSGATDSFLLLLLELLDCRVSAHGSFSERGGGLVELFLEISRGCLAVHDKLKASLVLANASLLLLLELLDVGVALRSSFSERGGGLVELILEVCRGCLAVRDELQGGFVLADASLLLLLELLDRRVSARGSFCERGGGLAELFFEISRGGLAVLDELERGLVLANAGLLLLLELLDVSAALLGGADEGRGSCVELALEIRCSGLAVRDDGLTRLVLPDAGLLLFLELLDVGIAARCGFGERGGGLTQLFLKISRGGLGVRDELQGGFVLADAGLLLVL